MRGPAERIGIAGLPGLLGLLDQVGGIFIKSICQLSHESPVVAGTFQQLLQGDSIKDT